MSTINTINHLPVFRGIRLCGAKTGTAYAFSHISCEDCRAKLELKAQASEKQASASVGSESVFFDADAKRVRTMLNA